MELDTNSSWKVSTGVKVLASVSGIIIPVLCFIFVFFLRPEDQTQPKNTLYSGLLWYPNGCLFYILALYSLISLITWMYSPPLTDRFFFWRLGLYSGVVLFVPFTVIFTSASISQFFRGDFFENLRTCLGLSLISTVATYIYASSNVFEIDKPVFWRSGRRILAVAAWCIGYVVAWKYALHRAAELYASLSQKVRGDCYVVTAAAQGHRWFVGSRPVVVVGGQMMAVNDQLRYLKAGELALKATLPRFHRLLRVVYDVTGPLLARCLFCAVLADIAYITLKPAEWMCRLALRLTLRAHTRKIAMSVYNAG